MMAMNPLDGGDAWDAKAKLVRIDTNGYVYYKDQWELGIVADGKFMTAFSLDKQQPGVMVLIPITAVTAVHFQTEKPTEAADAK